MRTLVLCMALALISLGGGIAFAFGTSQIGGYVMGCSLIAIPVILEAYPIRLAK